MPELIEYVRTLADDIGPRPATTDAEHRAADWLAQTFGQHGLETEVHEFDAPRTYAWAYVLYHLLTIASVVVAGNIVMNGRFAWAGVAVSALVAFFMYNDLETKWGLTRLMPKGPSQNVIARHVPRARRGERLRKIVVVAHYDSARASAAFAPGMVKNFPTTFGLMKFCTFFTPVLVLAMALPFTAKAEPYLWYVSLVVAGYLVVPLVINVHRELFMPFVPGANDNASGVAAMLGVMQNLVPAPDAASLSTGSFPRLRRDFDTAEAAGVIPPGAEVTYPPAERDQTELPDDFRWAETDEGAAPAPSRGRASERDEGLLSFDTIEFAAVGNDEPGVEPERQRPPITGSWESAPAEERPARPAPSLPGDTLPPDVAGYGEDELAESKPKRSLFGGLGAKRRQRKETEEVGDWLGVGEDFDARKAGAEIGSWDNFGGEDNDDDGLGWKGGWAGDDPIEDDDFAANEAARIRRRVTETVDRELTEKEIWFVATGAEEVGTYGMQALLRDYGEELRDALIINIDGAGAGHLFWASAEGMGRKHRASARLVGLARRVSRETETIIKPRVFKGLSTDASPALARGYKAISIMALDVHGLPQNWHWKTDTSDEIDPELLEKTAEFVTAMVREA